MSSKQWNHDPDLISLKRVIHEAKKIAMEYREITGKPLGITGEVGEFVAADLLGLTLTEARQPGYDAAYQYLQSKGQLCYSKVNVFSQLETLFRLGFQNNRGMYVPFLTLFQVHGPGM